MDQLRQLYLDLVFGNGGIALGVLVTASVVVTVARVTRIIRF